MVSAYHIFYDINEVEILTVYPDNGNLYKAIYITIFLRYLLSLMMAHCI